MPIPPPPPPYPVRPRGPSVYDPSTFGEDELTTFARKQGKESACTQLNRLNVRRKHRTFSVVDTSVEKAIPPPPHSFRAIVDRLFRGRPSRCSPRPRPFRRRSVYALFVKRKMSIDLFWGHIKNCICPGDPNAAMMHRNVMSIYRVQRRILHGYWSDNSRI